MRGKLGIAAGTVLMAALMHGAAGAHDREWRPDLAQDDAAQGVRTRLLSEAAAMQRETPAAWAAHEAAVKAILDEHGARTRGWRYQRPPPPPDLRPAGLPAAFLMAKVRGVEGDFQQRMLERAYLTALVASEDPRGLEAALELHDHREGVRRSHAAGTIAGAVPPERIGKALTHALRGGAPVRNGVLALRLLERARDAAGLREIALEGEVRAGAHAWLATYEGGPANGLGDTVWQLRLRLGGPEDRDALVPHLRDEEDLLYDLRAILEAPLPHAALADALRERRARMTEHERSFLIPHMRRAIVVTDPKGEIDVWIEHLDALLERADTGEPTDEALYQFQVDALVLAHIEHPKAEHALERYVRDDRLSWVWRGTLVAFAAQRGHTLTDDLVEWFERNAPPPVLEGLRAELARGEDAGALDR